ncbi:MAG: haloacid dehalogenase type II, partial [Acetobacteraceae bacterium]
GTLLDVDSAMRAHAGRLGSEWQRISREWRTKHLEYSWVRTLAGAPHRDFWQLARESLDVVAERNGIADRALLDDVLAAYRRLDAYPEVPNALRALRGKGIACAIYSNGTPEMLAEAASHAGIADLLDAILSVEAAGIFKPHPRGYRLATDHFGLNAEEMAFFSSNAWDAFGAGVFGFRVFWVNRASQPAEYELASSATVLDDLRNVPLERPDGRD